MEEDLSCAYAAFFGSYVPVENIEIVSFNTPESYMIEKEVLSELKGDKKELAEMIVNLPARLLNNSGKIKKLKFQRYCKRVKGWSPHKVEKLKEELGFFLRSFKF